MCRSSLLMLFSHMLIIFLKAHCLSSSFVVVFDVLAEVIIATFGSTQRQSREKPTFPLLAIVEGIPASVKLLDDSWVSTWT